VPSIASKFAENMRFSGCLPSPLATEVARKWLIDPAAVERVLSELTNGSNQS
jgi:hypothetical protein